MWVIFVRFGKILGEEAKRSVCMVQTCSGTCNDKVLKTLLWPEISIFSPANLFQWRPSVRSHPSPSSQLRSTWWKASRQRKAVRGLTTPKNLSTLHTCYETIILPSTTGKKIKPSFSLFTFRNEVHLTRRWKATRAAMVPTMRPYKNLRSMKTP